MSGNFSHCWKLSRLSGNFPDCSETFQTVWKVSEQSGNFPDKYSIVCSIVATSISCTFVRRVLTCMSRKQFTHFWHIFVAKAIYALLAHICRETIYALRPESFCAWYSADRKVWTFCVSGGSSPQGSRSLAALPSFHHHYWHSFHCTEASSS